MDETTEYISKLVKEGFEVLICREPMLDDVQFRLRRGNLNCEVIVNQQNLIKSGYLQVIPILKRLVEQIETLESATGLNPTRIRWGETLRLSDDKFISCLEGNKR